LAREDNTHDLQAPARNQLEPALSAHTTHLKRDTTCLEPSR
jgi:hypothetical protein